MNMTDSSLLIENDEFSAHDRSETTDISTSSANYQNKKHISINYENQTVTFGTTVPINDRPDRSINSGSTNCLRDNLKYGLDEFKRDLSILETGINLDFLVVILLGFLSCEVMLSFISFIVYYFAHYVISDYLMYCLLCSSCFWGLFFIYIKLRRKFLDHRNCSGHLYKYLGCGMMTIRAIFSLFIIIFTFFGYLNLKPFETLDNK